MKLVKKEMIHWMDQKASDDYGIPSILLMEHAALALFNQCQTIIHPKEKVLIVCGPGNNGGDGFALARLLFQHHYDVEVFSCVDFMKMSHDEQINANISKALQIPYYDDLAILETLIQKTDVVIDAIFGVGLSRDIQGDYVKIIQLINQNSKKIISIDIPSGIDGNLGIIKGIAIKAHHTLTLAAYKEGLFLNDARTHCGKIHLLDIDMPEALNQSCEGAQVLNHIKLPMRSDYSHKGTYGKALMIGGSKEMHGALTMAAKACLKSGIGTLTLFVPDCIHHLLAMKLEECMIVSAPSCDGSFHENAYQLLQKIIHQYDFIMIGNGMGRNKGAFQLVETLLQSDKPCIIDGDAIYLAAKCKIHQNQSIVITPHVKEMSYLCHVALSDIIKDPFTYIRDYANQYPNMTIVYKDAYTYIQNNQDAYFYYQPNAVLAKGGSGDVLCGIIAGMYGQNKNMLEAACCGVYIHNKCAKQSYEKWGSDSGQANDLIDEIYDVIKKLRENTCKK